MQHLDPSHESILADLLQRVTKIPVLEVTDNIKVSPDHIYIIPSNKLRNQKIRYYKTIVKDNGIGFKQKYADQIFLIFHRLHNQNEFSGTGIGLALCKKIVVNHKGE